MGRQNLSALHAMLRIDLPEGACSHRLCQPHAPPKIVFSEGACPHDLCSLLAPPILLPENSCSHIACLPNAHRWESLYQRIDARTGCAAPHKLCPRTNLFMINGVWGPAPCSPMALDLPAYFSAFFPSPESSTTALSTSTMPAMAENVSGSSKKISPSSMATTGSTEAKIDALLAEMPVSP